MESAACDKTVTTQSDANIATLRIDQEKLCDISNQHYCHLREQEIEQAWLCCPLICKLADFGESRSSEVQTNSVLNSQTSRVNRGTPVYMAPEILVGMTRLTVATIEDMKRADTWALGMTLFVLLNPSVKYPYHRELQLARTNSCDFRLTFVITHIWCLSSLLSQETQTIFVRACIQLGELYLEYF